MEKYKDWSPTQWDSKGLCGESAGIGDYSVFLIRTRDADAIELSNFRTALERLGGDGGEDSPVQVHTFGHWACGWYDIILVKPDTWQHKEAEKIIESLEDYPILDEMDYEYAMIETGEIDDLYEGEENED